MTHPDSSAIACRPIGLPKTGVFALMDLVGIDLIPHVMESMLAHLHPDDAFHEIAGAGDDIIGAMLADGYTGRKGKGGFYRLNREGGGKVKEARNLNTGEYAVANRKAAFPSAKMSKQGLGRLLDHHDEGAAFVNEVLLDTFCYAANLVPEVTEDISNIDGAMRVGYNWKLGPFEMKNRCSKHRYSPRSRWENGPRIHRSRGPKRWLLHNRRSRDPSSDAEQHASPSCQRFRHSHSR